MRDSFVFYRSFYEALCEVDETTQLIVYKAIIEYSINGVEIELDGINKAMFKLIKPQLDANYSRYENGKKGGAPKGNTNAKKPKENTNKNNQKTTKNNQKQPNVNVNVNVNDNVNDNLKHMTIKPSFDCVIAFEEFWNEYPKKVAKQKCLQKFKTVCATEKDFSAIMTGLSKYNELQYKFTETQFIPNPLTWLNQSRWLDEVQPVFKKSKFNNEPSVLKLPQWKIDEMAKQQAEESEELPF